MSERQYYVSATQLLGADEIVEGGESVLLPLLEKSGIQASKLGLPDSVISFRSMVLLHEIAAKELQCESIGLKWALATPAHFPNLGPLVLMSKMTSTIQEWIDLGQKYWKFHTNAFSMQQLTEPATGAGIFRYVLHSHAPASRQYAEHAIANMVLLARKVTGYDGNPLVVRFQHAPPRDLTLHEQIFRCPIEFNAEHTEIHFDPMYLSQKTDGTLAFLKPIVGYYMRHRIRRLPIYDQTMTMTVALAVPSIMGTGKCNVEFVAETIGLSAKRLRRLLATEGTNFSDILDRVRSDIARDLIANSDAPIASIAGLLDYSSTAPFTLAFRRWTGEAPRDFRRSHKNSPEVG